jgi:hypothetical protein
MKPPLLISQEKAKDQQYTEPNDLGYEDPDDEATQQRSAICPHIITSYTITHNYHPLVKHLALS